LFIGFDCTVIPFVVFCGIYWFSSDSKIYLSFFLGNISLISKILGAERKQVMIEKKPLAQTTCLETTA